MPELSEMFQSSCTKAGAELGWMQRPAALRVNLQLWCKEDSQTDRLDGGRLCGLTACSLVLLLGRWSRFPSSAGLTMSNVLFLCQDRGNQFELKHTFSLPGVFLEIKMSRNILRSPPEEGWPICAPHCSLPGDSEVLPVLQCDTPPGPGQAGEHRT